MDTRVTLEHRTDMAERLQLFPPGNIPSVLALNKCRSSMSFESTRRSLSGASGAFGSTFILDAVKICQCIACGKRTAGVGPDLALAGITLNNAHLYLCRLFSANSFLIFTSIITSGDALLTESRLYTAIRRLLRTCCLPIPDMLRIYTDQ